MRWWQSQAEQVQYALQSQAFKTELIFLTKRWQSWPNDLVTMASFGGVIHAPINSTRFSWRVFFSVATWNNTETSKERSTMTEILPCELVGTPIGYGLREHGHQNGGCCRPKNSNEKHPINHYAAVVVDFCLKCVSVLAAVQSVSHIFVFKPIIADNLDRVLSELVSSFVQERIGDFQGRD